MRLGKFDASILAAAKRHPESADSQFILKCLDEKEERKKANTLYWRKISDALLQIAAQVKEVAS
jgi:hypothetical protein